MDEAGAVFRHPKVEYIVKKVTWRYDIDGHNKDDLKQIARMAIWEKVFPKHPVCLENFENYLGLMYWTARSALMHALRDSFAEKRLQLTKIRSIDEPFGSDRGGEATEDTFEDTLGSLGEEPSQLIRGKEVLFERLERAKRISLKQRTRVSIVVVMNLLCDVLECSKEELAKKDDSRFYDKLDLRGWLKVLFEGSPYRALRFAFPEMDLRHISPPAPNAYWSGPRGRDRARRALRAALRQNSASEEDYPKMLSREFFKCHKLVHPLTQIYCGNRFAYLDDTFPRRYHPWELPNTTKYFEDPEHVVQAVRWLVEEELHIPVPELSVKTLWQQRVAQRITRNVFFEHGLFVIKKKYGSPGPVLRMAYPDKWLPWSFNEKGMWQGEEGKALAARAVRWCLEEYLELDPRTTKITWDHFGKNGFAGMMNMFRGSAVNALNNAYPEWIGQFK